ncbi:DeoR/GlpR family DNA-binding transcription regulator [Curtobacterium sp. RRHDQ10]|uniref:DeoR/GlpR family DNA-binding transcription regulator n=1 Tax=Curtobacterium phyllosphaerae TaxID=3413379 RepID=UPI003BF369E1
MPEKEKLSRQERQQRILDHVLRDGTATVAELAEITGRSLMTTHRDVEDLATRRLIRKFHGGVSALPTSSFESSSEFRRQHNTAAKEALARVAIRFVEPGMAVMIDDSTTVLALARLLPDRGPLTVVTNYRVVLEELRGLQDISLIAVGGTYSRTHDSYIGPPDQTNLDAYAVDVTFQSTSTMDTSMTYHQEQDIVAMKRVMLRRGGRRVLMMDGSKIGQTSLYRYLPLSDFTDIVLTSDVGPEIRDAIGEHVQVHLASV